MLAMGLLLAGCVKDNIQENTVKETISEETIVAVESIGQIRNTEIKGIIQTVSDTEITLAVVDGRQKPLGKVNPGGRKAEDRKVGDRKAEDRIAEDRGESIKTDVLREPNAKPDNMPEGKKLERKADTSHVSVGLSVDTEIVDSDGTPITIAELKAGNMVMVETDESNTALEITVQLLQEESLNSQ